MISLSPPPCVSICSVLATLGEQIPKLDGHLCGAASVTDITALVI